MIVRMVASSANRTATLATLFQTELAVFAAQGETTAPRHTANTGARGGDDGIREKLAAR
jgi:hypothetical protein